ncbi:28S ribosomal protein S29, mitochondrial isoform X3 [Mauremys mutica]|uniref:28S ribosomal protein S29, mitochondrial isoform X3 n=1 Tax=Mauremys mutica TaxID=74926 RepID=UPI001D168B94|nr:28S ribosomal protein S29, mitochondrial isoform X3 [Mauremys mutica]
MKAKHSKETVELAPSYLTALVPANHAEQHEGQHYSIPLQEVKVVFPHGLPYRFQMQMKTFNESCLMVRKPALELLGYLKNTNFAHPAIRYVIYGEKGTGKTMTLCHAVHYCAKQDWLVLHIPDAHLWVKNCRELMQSSYNKERFDQPLEASTWLKNFKTSNDHFLKEIKTQQTYMWSKRESTEKGRPLGEVVEQGLTRVKNASDAVGVVLKELKKQCPLGSFRLLVAVDGINALWGRTTLRKKDKSAVSPEELTLVHNLRKMVVNDWNGGAIVTTLSQTGSLFKPRSAYLPHELLGKVSTHWTLSFPSRFPITVSESLRAVISITLTASGFNMREPVQKKGEMNCCFSATPTPGSWNGSLLISDTKESSLAATAAF